MAQRDLSSRSGGNNKEHQDSPKIKSNLSGLKHSLHGTSFQLKLGVVVCLANAKRSLDPTNGFSFTMDAEDPAAGKFDDIVYSFKDGERTGILKIQVKHKLGWPPPNITVNDFTTNNDTKNAFAILKYFTSFCDQQQSTTDLAGFVICTNANINEQAKNIWKTVEPAVTNDSEPSLDVYVASLFDSIGGKYYQLDYDKLWAVDGTYSNLYQLMRKCSKRARLARLLVEATKPNKRITFYNSLVKEYRQAILGVIDRNEISTNDSYGFTKEFLVLSSSNSKPGYEAFRKECEEQYRQEYNINGSVWNDLKLKRVHVANDFLLGEKTEYYSSDTFPDDNVDESFKSFCNRFRLVCGTYSKEELDDAIVKIWRNLHYDDYQLVADQRKGPVETMVTERLFKTNFDWLMDPFAKPLHSDDIKASLENIERTLAHMELKPISDKLRKKVVGSPFRVSANVLKDSELYELAETESVLVVEAFDIQFGASVLSDVLDLQSKDHTTTLFLEGSDFINGSGTVESVLRCIEPPSCLVIICNEEFTKVQTTVRKWKRDVLKGVSKQLFLMKKSSNSAADFGCFRLCDMTEESWEQFQNENITVCGTTVSPLNIFQTNFKELSIELVIELLAWGQQMEESNEIAKKYWEIETTYVHRPWVDLECTHEAESLGWNKDSDFYKTIKELQQEGMNFSDITNRLKKDAYFKNMFGMSNNAGEQHEPIVGDESKKVLILLGEAGLGKSTNLTWLAWHLRKRSPLSWVVRCNLSDYCTDFKPFLQDRNNRAGKDIDETEALGILYNLVRSSLQLEPEMADICSKCLELSDDEVTLNGDLMENYGLSLKNSIQLMVFKDKFNSEELVLLLDGFDEIAPHYKEVVLMFLSHFEQFKGVRKLYLTSRPYGFKKHFEESFKDPTFFVLKPLSLRDKGFILYKIMKRKWYKENINDGKMSDFYKSLCIMLLCSLGNMSNVPLNLMMAVEILGDYVYHNENFSIIFSSQPFNRKLFETILDLSKASFIVEEFVKVKIRHLLYEKNGVDKNVANKPQEIDRFEKIIDEEKLLHGFVALWVFFNQNERCIFLSESEICQAEAYMDKIREGREKTGIIHGIQNGVPMFIHRTFAEYLAAWWIVKRRIAGNQHDRKTITCLESFWDRKELRANIDIILAKHYSLHVAIIERNWRTVESLLSNQQVSLYERDEGNRTPLHLLLFYYNFESNWPQFLPDVIESQIINCKEKLFGWTALDFAFHMDKPQLICYLLHHGATINLDFLIEYVALAGKDRIRKAAKFARYVMEYLSRRAIEFELHDACEKMKQFCDKVVDDLINETSANFTLTNDRDYMDCDNEISFIRDIILEDSVWMLESLIHRWADRKHFVQMIRNSFFDLMLENNSIFVLKYCMTNDPPNLNDDKHLKCAVQAAVKDYKIEFKYFFDIFCSQSRIKDFHPCPIKSDELGIFKGVLKSTIDKAINNICWAKLGISGRIEIDENIFCLLAVCVVTERSSILRYLIESCKLNLCAGLVYSLAMITNNSIAEIPLEATIKPSRAYECLLDLAPNITDGEANKMLRLSITSNLFEFSKSLIDRYNIDFYAVDELEGWNVFHLFASNQQTFWIEEIIPGEYDFSADCVRTDLFRYMLAKASDMDCFKNCDKKGRSIIHIAMENEQRGIVAHILARKLGLSALNEIRNLSIGDIANITFCYRAIYELSKCVKQARWHYLPLCALAKQIAKISLTELEESQDQNSGRLLLQENAEELYQIAMTGGSLFLVYYLHRVFPSTVPPFIYDGYWLVCTTRSLCSPEFLDVTKWLFNPNEVDNHVSLYEVIEECDIEEYNLSSVNLEKLVEQVEEKLMANRTVEEVCKLKLLTLAICLKRESMMRYLGETFNVSIDWKALIDIMETAHGSCVYKNGTKVTGGCAFEMPDFVPIYKYLFERTTNLGEIDAKGENVLHLAVQYGLGCMAKILIKHSMVNVTTTNGQNGWNIFHHYAATKAYWDCCYTDNDDLLTCITKWVLEITSDSLTYSSLTEGHKNKVKELCFNSNEGRQSVIHDAVEAGNIGMVEYMILVRLGIGYIDMHKMRSSEECLRFRELRRA